MNGARVRLRLATFNLENLDDRPGLAPTLAERIAALAPRLRRLEADVLCLQEVNGQEMRKGEARTLSALDALLADTAYAGYARAATEGAHGAFDVHNLVVLSRLPILACRQIRHELVAPPSYRMATAAPAARAAAPVEWERPILHATLAFPGGGALHVLNLHLRSPLAAFVRGGKTGPFSWASAAQWAEGFYLASMKRAGQALEARLAIDALFDREADARIAVLGDFNADHRQVPVRTMLARTIDTGNAALGPRVLYPVEQTVVERHTTVHAGRRATVDHVLVSAALLASFHHAEVHNEDLLDETLAPEGGPESSHAPVVAEFALES